MPLRPTRDRETKGVVVVLRGRRGELDTRKKSLNAINEPHWKCEKEAGGKTRNVQRIQSGRFFHLFVVGVSMRKRDPVFCRLLVFSNLTPRSRSNGLLWYGFSLDECLCTATRKRPIFLPSAKTALTHTHTHTRRSNKISLYVRLFSHQLVYQKLF